MPELTRRTTLTGTAAAGLKVSVGGGEIADAAVSKLFLPPTRAYRATPVASPATRHLVNRFSYGMNRDLFADVRRAGGPDRWLRKQLRPRQFRDPAARIIDWFPHLSLTPAQMARRTEAGLLEGHELIEDYLCWTLLRRIKSSRQLHEVMTEFWLNHLHVHGRSPFTIYFRMGYDQVIRRHALGRFDEMLAAAVVHPAMLFYLDGDLSRVIRRKKRGGGTTIEERINENLGRELLELHTVGKEARYSEDEVRDSAYLLTGWRIDRFHSWNHRYFERSHRSGPVSVLGFSHPNKYGDGRAAQRAYLRYLAHHPATARRIAQKLAVRFVSDDPSDDLVDELAHVFRRSGTDIGATLRALARHPEFRASAGPKVRTPVEDLVATHRVLGVRIRRPNGPNDAAHTLHYHSAGAGQEPFDWAPPDGFPDSNAVWSSTTRFLGSMRMHNGLSGGWYPRGNVRYRKPVSWLPKRRIRFDALVDHLCRTLLNRRSTPVLLGAACIATGTRPGEIITADHILVRHRMPRLLAALLDTPAHMTR
jgi:uncharacterized protein (DUF1800 family)